jgi:predicted PurR-regulated permease PerM
MVRLVGQRGVAWTELSALTVRSVAQGVIGIAIFQAFLALIGMVLIDVPFAWLWAFIVMLLTIMQLPALIILGPVIVYVYSSTQATPATIFAVYTLIVGSIDGVLKPLFLGRGVDIPMLVILLGAIGGMLLSGLLGLFVGAVGLALAYKLFMVWLEEA